MKKSCDDCAYRNRPRCYAQYTMRRERKDNGVCRLYYRKVKYRKGEPIDR